MCGYFFFFFLQACFCKSVWVTNCRGDGKSHEGWVLCGKWLCRSVDMCNCSTRFAGVVLGGNKGSSTGWDWLMLIKTKEKLSHLSAPTVLICELLVKFLGYWTYFKLAENKSIFKELPVVFCMWIWFVYIICVCNTLLHMLTYCLCLLAMFLQLVCLGLSRAPYGVRGDELTLGEALSSCLCGLTAAGGEPQPLHSI